MVQMTASKIPYPKICALCKKEFIARKATTRFCSHRCGARAYKMNLRNEKAETVLQDTIKVLNADIEKINAKSFLSVIEASLLLGISRWSVNRLIKKETINSRKLGGRRIISRESIQQIFNK
jgi:excisionase family DNA binding protein